LDEIKEDMGRAWIERRDLKTEKDGENSDF
jgi:hypothetical protein